MARGDTPLAAIFMSRNVVAATSLVVLAVVMGFAFQDTWRAIVRVWNSESFAHGWIIPPIAAWLVWQRRGDLARCDVAPFWPAAAGTIVCGCAWLVGRLAGVNALEQFALVAMFQCVVALCIGWQVYRTIAFPLLFLLFAVPFGEFLQPPLMEMTASFTVTAIRMSGIPIVREGLHFELPTGRWSVVEACSGLRYVLAAMPIACIYAYLTYRSLKTRLLFVLTVLLVAVVANWVRAYMIVILGHISGMTIAVGVDHIIYGWVFFGIVMALSFWVGSFWEDAPDHARRDTALGPSIGSPVVSTAPSSTLAAMIGAMAVGVAGIAVWPSAADALFNAGRPTVRLSALDAVVSRGVAPEGTGRYHPMYSGGIGRIFGQSLVEPEVSVYVAQYLHQNRDGEMLNWGNRIVPGDAEDLTWRVVSRVEASAPNVGGDAPTLKVNEYQVHGPPGRLLVWEWFTVNGVHLNDSRRIKIQTALDLLRGRGDESIAWFVWTEIDGKVEAARIRLARVARSVDSSSGLARLTDAGTRTAVGARDADPPR